MNELAKVLFAHSLNTEPAATKILRVDEGPTGELLLRNRFGGVEGRVVEDLTGKSTLTDPYGGSQTSWSTDGIGQTNFQDPLGAMQGSTDDFGGTTTFTDDYGARLGSASENSLGGSDLFGANHERVGSITPDALGAAVAEVPGIEPVSLDVPDLGSGADGGPLEMPDLDHLGEAGGLLDLF